MEAPADNPYVKNPDTGFQPVEELGKKEAEEQAEKLRDALNYHDHMYYVENSPVIADKTYDQLFRRLEELEEEFDLDKENSPTQRVGAPVDEMETREHVVKMLSLDASEDEEDVRAFDRRVREEVGDIEYHCEPKFDGLSIEIVYEDGEFQRAVTRGNGIEGDDVSANVRTIREVPLRIDEDGLLAVRGEIYMPRQEFQELNREQVERGEDPFANPRNAAAGTIRQLDPEIVARRPLKIYFYDVMETSLELESQAEELELLDELGLRTCSENRLVSDIDGFIGYRNELMEKRAGLEYEIDGVVTKVNSYVNRDTLGVTARHPKWAYAYKFPARKEETWVEKIVVQVGRTGKITPVALLEPVDVKGVTISRATLHNKSQVEELGVAEGAKVKVERAGDVIPEVVEVIEDGNGDFEMPAHCPVCGSPVEPEGEHHFCTGGVSCGAQLKRGLEHFTSREAMDIEGVGEKVAEQLVDTRIVDEIPDLYRLEKDELTALERFGDKSAEKLLEQVEDSKDRDLASFIFALGIRHVGKETARLLAENFKLEELMKSSREQLRGLDGIGPEVATSITDFFESHGAETVEDLLDEGVEPGQYVTGDELEGLTLVVTGSLEEYTREELKELLERHGADVNSSVSSNTDYLVVGDNPGENKLSGAEEHSIEMLDEEELMEKIIEKIE